MGLAISARRLAAAGSLLAVSLTPCAALAEDEGDYAIKARQGLMQVIGWEAGPLFGMAKGQVPYDAEAAAHAANLSLLAGYDFTGLFPEGTSKADRPGKTRALADLWADELKFAQAYEDYRASVAALSQQAGGGQEALTAAVTDLGKACGGCHKPFRADDF